MTSSADVARRLQARANHPSSKFAEFPAAAAVDATQPPAVDPPPVDRGTLEDTVDAINDAATRLRLLKGGRRD
jgi:hypothetical protein